jgi:hypothetical protein
VAVKILNSDEHPWSVTREVGDSATGVRHYLVDDTPDPARAVLAAGLPALNDPWDATGPLMLQRLRAKSLTTVKSVARHDAADVTTYPLVTDKGITIVRVDYATEDRVAIFPTLNKKWTRMEVDDATVTALYDRRAASDPLYREQLNGGDGFPLEVGRITLTVHHYRSSASITAGLLERMRDYAERKVVNSDGVTIPNIDGLSITWTAAAGELRYLGFLPIEKAAGTGLYLFRHRLAWSADHRPRDLRRGSNGLATGTVVQPELYEPAAFMDSPALW